MAENKDPSQQPEKETADEKQDSTEDAEARSDEEVAPGDDDRPEPKPLRPRYPGLLGRLDFCDDFTDAEEKD